MTPDEEVIDRQRRLQDAGMWLRSERDARGWTGSDLARRLNVTQVRVSSYERGQYEVPQEIAEHLADIFELPIIEVRKRLGLWVPSAEVLSDLEGYVDPSRLSDDILIQELVKRYKGKPSREIVNVYSTRADVPSSLWDHLLSSARSEILLGGYTNYFFWTERPRFGEILREKGRDGLRIRILLGNPDGEVTERREKIERASLSVSSRINITLEQLVKLGPIPGLEVRMSDRNADAHVSRSVFRFDDEILVSEHIADHLGHGSLTFHIRRLGPGGPFDQYVEHVEHLWVGAREWAEVSHSE